MSQCKDSCARFYVCTSVSTWLLFQWCVTTDSSFGYLREAPGLRKGLQRFRIFHGKNAVFFHHGFAPDGLTLSAGGLAATSLKTDHCAFAVLLMRSCLYMQAVVHMNPSFIPPACS